LQGKDDPSAELVAVSFCPLFQVDASKMLPRRGDRSMVSDAELTPIDRLDSH